MSTPDSKTESTHGFPRAYITAVVKDRDGKIVSKAEFEARSFVGNLLRMLGAIFSVYVNTANQATLTEYPMKASVSVVDWSGQAVYPYLRLDWYGGCQAKDDTCGILVGTGTASVTLTDYNMSKIPHSDTGLSYGAMSVTSITVSTTSGTLQLQRSFTNNGTSSYTITEFALALRYSVPGDAPAGTQGYMLLARDVYTTGVVVGPGQTLIVTYTITQSLS